MGGFRGSGVVLLVGGLECRDFRRVAGGEFSGEIAESIFHDYSNIL